MVLSAAGTSGRRRDNHISNASERGEHLANAPSPPSPYTVDFPLLRGIGCRTTELLWKVNFTLRSAPPSRMGPRAQIGCLRGHRKSKSVGRGKEAVRVVFGWVQANVKMAVFGRNGVAIRNSEEVLPCNEVMVPRVEQHPETVRTGAHAGVRNFSAIASFFVPSAASRWIGPSRLGVVGGSAIPARQRR